MYIYMYFYACTNQKFFLMHNYIKWVPICMHTHTHTCAQTRKHAYIYIYAYMCVRACIYTLTHMHTHSWQRNLF